jgi:type IV pilus assembly protein PilE
MTATMLKQNPTNQSRDHRGFTLIEVVVAMAILAILLTLAYPAYLNQAIKARRADGHSLLYEAAQRQQQQFTENNAFTATVGSGGLDMNAGSQEGYYTLSITQPSGNTTYTLTATAVAPQTADTSCGNLTLTHLNVKGCTATGCDVDRCW